MHAKPPSIDKLKKAKEAQHWLPSCGIEPDARQVGWPASFSTFALCFYRFLFSGASSKNGVWAAIVSYARMEAITLNEPYLGNPVAPNFLVERTPRMLLGSANFGALLSRRNALSASSRHDHYRIVLLGNMWLAVEVDEVT